MDTTAVQRALIALGYSLVVDGIAGPKTKMAVQVFQRGQGLAADGIVGPLTIAALQAAVAAKSGAGQPLAGRLPADWVPVARMNRVIVHWTAGAHRASGLDRSHYHILIEGDGHLIRGSSSIALNDAGGARKGYVEHTKAGAPTEQAGPIAGWLMNGIALAGTAAYGIWASWREKAKR